MSYAVVVQFEQELCRYTGARYAVTTNSCTMAIWLSLAWCFLKLSPFGTPTNVGIPRRTYCSVAQTIKLLGGNIVWDDRYWSGSYRLTPYPLYDAARWFSSGMMKNIPDSFVCVSFQTSKILGIEQGGAILHDNAEADEWLRRARFDGRLNASEKLPQQIGWHCYMNPSTAALGSQKLACLPRDNPDQAGAADFDDLSELPCFR